MPCLYILFQRFSHTHQRKDVTAFQKYFSRLPCGIQRNFQYCNSDFFKTFSEAMCPVVYIAHSAHLFYHWLYHLLYHSLCTFPTIPYIYYCTYSTILFSPSLYTYSTYSYFNLQFISQWFCPIDSTIWLFYKHLSVWSLLAKKLLHANTRTHSRYNMYRR